VILPRRPCMRHIAIMGLRNRLDRVLEPGPILDMWRFGQHVLSVLSGRRLFGEVMKILVIATTVYSFVAQVAMKTSHHVMPRNV